MAWGKKYKKVRKPRASEDTHVLRGVIGAVIVIAMLVASIAYFFPPPSSASAPVAKAQARGPQ